VLSVKYKPYPKMKNSGIEWIGEIPEEWKVTKLGYFVNSTQLGTNVVADSDSKSGIFLLKMGNMQFGSFNLNKVEHVNPNEVENFQSLVLKKGDFLFNTRNSADLVGKCGVWTETNLYGIFNNNILRIYFDNRLEPLFVSYFLNSSIGYTLLRQKINQTTNVGAIYYKDLSNVMLFLPLLEEQKQIVEFLDKKTVKIDSKIQKNQKLVTLLQEKRQATINHAVTKGLDPNVPMKDSGIEWIGEIPEFWEQVKLKHISQIRGRVGWKGYTVEDLVDDGALVIGAKHIQDFHLDLSDAEHLSWSKYYESPEIMVKVNDLLLVQRGSLGKAVLIDKDFGPMTINPSMILITKFNEEPKFLWYQFQSNLIQNVVESIKQATAVPMISQENVKEFRLLLPIKSEQQQISDFLDKQTAKIDSLISITQIQIEKLQEFRQSLISAAVTGKIDVRTNHEEVN